MVVKAQNIDQYRSLLRTGTIVAEGKAAARLFRGTNAPCGLVISSSGCVLDAIIYIRGSMPQMLAVIRRPLSKDIGESVLRERVYENGMLPVDMSGDEPGSDDVKGWVEGKVKDHVLIRKGID